MKGMFWRDFDATFREDPKNVIDRLTSVFGTGAFTSRYDMYAYDGDGKTVVSLTFVGKKHFWAILTDDEKEVIKQNHTSHIQRIAENTFNHKFPNSKNTPWQSLQWDMRSIIQDETNEYCTGRSRCSTVDDLMVRASDEYTESCHDGPITYQYRIVSSPLSRYISQ